MGLGSSIVQFMAKVLAIIDFISVVNVIKQIVFNFVHLEQNFIPHPKVC